MDKRKALTYITIGGMMFAIYLIYPYMQNLNMNGLFPDPQITVVWTRQLAFTIFATVAMVWIGSIYVIYDLLNERDIPSWVAFAGLISGMVYIVAFLGINEAAGIAWLVAGLVLLIGFACHALFKNRIGLADFFLLATLILYMPIQNSPIFVHASQQGLPFLLTLISNSLIPICVYGLWLAHKKQRHMPLTVPIYASLIISLLIGNLVLL